MRLVHLIKSLLTPSTHETLHTFRTKIKALRARIDINVDEINYIDNKIDELQSRKLDLELDIERAEKAAEKLADIDCG